MIDRSLYDEFSEALEKEITCIKRELKEEGKKPYYILYDGQLVDRYGNEYIYEFTSKEPIELNDDINIDARINSTQVKGTIITINGPKVLIGLNLDEDISKYKVISKIEITVDASYLLETLRERLRNVKDEKVAFNEDIAMKTFNCQGAPIKKDYNFSTDWEKLELPISQEQKEALAQAIGSDITFIWGPPGTGKTTIISYLAVELLQKGKSILLVSHTNVAVDNAIEKIAKILKKIKYQGYFDGSILRVGVPVRKKLFEEFRELSLKYCVEKKKQEIEKELREYEELKICSQEEYNKTFQLQWKEEMGKISQKIEELKTQLTEYSPGYFILLAKLIATTITKGYIEDDIFHRSFDVVIVDEASMASLPALFCNCGLAKSKVIIVGDFRQLAPITCTKQTETDDAPLLGKDILSKDIYYITGIEAKINKGREEERLVILQEQRRMPKEIAELVNGLVYGGRLKTEKKPMVEDKKEKEVIASEPFSGEKIILCDTSALNPWCHKTKSGSHYKSKSGSHFNVFNAFLSVFLAEKFKQNKIDSVAILTPFKAQNGLIYKLLLDKKVSEIIPATIHRFQGKESDVIIFDLVEGPETKIVWLNDKLTQDATSNAMRLINVAITRSRSKIIFIANLSYFKENLGQYSILKHILERVEKNHSVVDVLKLFPISYTIEQQHSLKKSEDTSALFVYSSSFYTLFKEDLLRAEDRIVILSPSLDTNNLLDFYSSFEKLYLKEVKTLIITSQEIETEIIGDLKKFDVEIILKDIQYKKLAIIDNKIIWFGNTDIFSPRNGEELIVRLTVPAGKFVESVLKYCDIDTKDIEDIFINKKIEELNEKGGDTCGLGHHLTIMRDKSGTFLYCQCGKQPPTIEIIKQIFGKKYLYCEKCSSPMQVKHTNKKEGWFLGCSSYSKSNCRFTRSL